MKSVYFAVRTGSLNKAVCASSFRTNSDLCHLQHKLIGFYNRCRECLLRGTHWVFKSDTVSSLKGVFEKCTFHLFMLHNVLSMSSTIHKSGLYILTGARFRKRTYEFDLQLLTPIGPCRSELDSTSRCTRYSVELRSTQYCAVFYAGSS
jgi:hypothetical protein